MNELLIQKAIIFATQKHEGQKRKGTDIPYIVRPMEVMQILTAMIPPRKRLKKRSEMPFLP